MFSAGAILVFKNILHIYVFYLAFSVYVEPAENRREIYTWL